MTTGAVESVSPRRRLHPERLGLLTMLIAVFGYSCLPVFTGKLQELEITPVEIGLWRYAITVPVFWAMAAFAARKLGHSHTAGEKPLPQRRLLVMGILLAGAALCAFFGLERISAGTYVVIFYTYPAMTALLALFLGDRLSGLGWLALAFTLVGVVLTAPDFSDGLSGGNFIGVALALMNALIVAVYFTLNSWLLRGQSAVVRAAALTGTGALGVLALVGLLIGVRVPSNPMAWLYLAGLALVSTVMPMICINIGIQRLGAARAAVLGSIEPLLTSVLALIFLGQQMAPMQWLGGAVIVASVIMLQTLGGRTPSNALQTEH